MEATTLSTQVNSLNNHLVTAIDNLNKALQDLSGIANAVSKLGEISALLGSVGPVVGAVGKPKRTRRTKEQIEAEKANGVATGSGSGK